MNFDDIRPKRPLSLLQGVVPGREDLLKHYSLSRAIRAADPEGLGADAGYEREVSRAIEQQMGAPPHTGGFWVPLSLPLSTRAGLDSKTTAAGLELKFTEPADLIGLLRAKSRVLRLGGRFVGDLRGKIAYPRLTGAATGAWMAENPGSDVADSNLALDQAGPLAPRIFTATSSYSVNLLAQSTPNVDDVVRQDLALISALALDAAAIAGAGGNSPTGILNIAAVPTIALGTNGVIPKFDDLTNCEETVGLASADIGQLGWLTTPSLRRRFRKIGKIDFAASGDPTWSDDSTMLGYPAEVSTNVPSNLTKGTSTTICHAILFGNWNELLVAGWGALEIVVDPFTKKKQNMVEITSYLSVDVVLRHPLSFVKIVDALK